MARPRSGGGGPRTADLAAQAGYQAGGRLQLADPLPLAAGALRAASAPAPPQLRFEEDAAEGTARALDKFPRHSRPGLAEARFELWATLRGRLEGKEAFAQVFATLLRRGAPLAAQAATMQHEDFIARAVGLFRGVGRRSGVGLLREVLHCTLGLAAGSAVLSLEVATACNALDRE
ncbi:unnamed protein product, partial [Prorocentrum cordatum]